MASTPGILIAILALLAGFALAAAFLRRHKQPSIKTYTTIEEMRSVGELVAFQILAKEIVTSTEHWAGQFGKKWLSWLWSSQKIAMIFEFEIDFKYDLRSSEFEIRDQGMGRFILKMPSCRYEIAIRGSQVYDVQTGKLTILGPLADLLPFFHGQLNEEDLNGLIAEAKKNIEAQAGNYVQTKKPLIEQSARQTLETLAKAFGAAQVSFDFSESKLVPKAA